MSLASVTFLSTKGDMSMFGFSYALLIPVSILIFIYLLALYKEKNQKFFIMYALFIVALNSFLILDVADKILGTISL